MACNRRAANKWRTQCSAQLAQRCRQDKNLKGGIRNCRHGACHDCDCLCLLAGIEGNFHPPRRIISVEAMQLAKHAVFLVKVGSGNSNSNGSSNGGSSSSSSSSGSSGGASSGSGRVGSGSSAGAGAGPTGASGGHAGLGVFVAGNRAVTADRHLGGAAVGSSLEIYIYAPEICILGMPDIPEAPVRIMQMRVVARNEELGYAVLECEDGDRAAPHPHFLQLCTGDPQLLRAGAPLAVCCFHVGIRGRDGLPEFLSSMGVARAEVVGLGKRGTHFAFTSAWPGGPALLGAALLPPAGHHSSHTVTLVVNYDGQLVGLHVAGVDALHEALDRELGLGVEERASAVVEESEGSLGRAARPIAAGCVALSARAFAADAVAK